MGGNKSTLVANGYSEAIQVRVTKDMAIVTEEDVDVHADVTAKLSEGVATAVAPDIGYKKDEKRRHSYVTPGFTTIAPNSFFRFAETGRDGKVFVTVKAGATILADNVQVKNGCGVIVGNEGGLHNVQHRGHWVDSDAIRYYDLIGHN